MKKAVIIMILLLLTGIAGAVTNKYIGQFNGGYDSWEQEAPWHATGTTNLNSAYYIEGTGSIELGYEITSPSDWGNAGIKKDFGPSGENWTNFKTFVFWARHKKSYGNATIVVTIYCKTNEWDYAERLEYETGGEFSYFKQYSLDLWTNSSFITQNGAKMPDSLTDVRKISIVGNGYSLCKGDILLDSIILTSKSNSTMAQFNPSSKSPEGYISSKTFTITANIGTGYTNLVLQVADNSGNLYIFRQGDNLNYSAGVISANVTVSSYGRVIILIDGLLKSDLSPVKQYFWTIYCGPSYIIDDFEGRTVDKRMPEWTVVTDVNGHIQDATGYVSDDSVSGDSSVEYTYSVSEQWDYGGLAKLYSPSDKWQNYDSVVFWYRSTNANPGSKSLLVYLYCNGPVDTNNVFCYEERNFYGYWKQRILDLSSTNDFKDVEWDSSIYDSISLPSALTDVIKLGFYVQQISSYPISGTLRLDGITLIKSSFLKEIEDITPEPGTIDTGTNINLVIDTGTEADNFSIQVVDENQNTRVIRTGFSVSGTKVSINLTGLYSDEIRLLFDAVDKSTGIPFIQKEWVYYKNSWYKLADFDTGSQLALWEDYKYNAVMNKSINSNGIDGACAEIDYQTTAEWGYAGLEYKFSTGLKDFSKFDVIQFYIKGNPANTGKLCIGFYDDENQSIDMNYEEDDVFVCELGEDYLKRDFWQKVEVPLNSGYFLDGNTNYGNDAVEFNKLEGIIIYVSGPETYSGKFYLDSIKVIGNISAGTQTVQQETGESKTYTISDITPVFESGKELKFNINALSEIKVKIEIYNINGIKIYEKDFDDISGEINFTWNAKNFYGREIDTGIYILKIEIDDGSKVRRILKKIYYVKR